MEMSADTTIFGFISVAGEVKKINTRHIYAYRVHLDIKNRIHAGIVSYRAQATNYHFRMLDFSRVEQIKDF